MGSVFKIKKGLTLPITGDPDQKITPGRQARTVALKGPDYVGMRPTMLVKEGDSVRLGQPLFSDKKNEGVIFTSPAAGRVTAINRGDRRALQSVVIAVSDGGAETFEKFPEGGLDSIPEARLRRVMIESGAWTALRTRPYSRTPGVESSPRSIFVTASDTNPLAADPAVVVAEHERDFVNGVRALTVLAPKGVHLCRMAGSKIPDPGHPAVTVHDFQGRHPAGLVGTHIHLVDPVNAERVVWHIGYQDVIALGKLLVTGQIWTERIVSLAGPAVKHPRLVRTRVGASTTDLVSDELSVSPARVVSGSVLSGDDATDGPLAFLGRYHLQVSVIRENRRRELLGWQMPGRDKYSTRPVYASALTPGKKFPLTTTTNGSKRAMVPIGMYEDVMPLDIIPTFLLRSLVSKDYQRAQDLGVLELDEEDLGLCTFVCPGKTEYAPLLREALTVIERDG